MLNKFKTVILSISIIVWFAWSFSLWLNWNYWYLDDKFPYEDEEKLVCNKSSTELWECTSVREKDDTIIVRLLEVFGLDYSTDRERDLKFIDYAKAIMNMALALVAFIALVMTIYTFYMVIFSENDEWIKKAKWNLVGIFIALAVIWLAWLIVSVIFWWYEDNWESREWYIETNAPSAVATKEITIDD